MPTLPVDAEIPRRVIVDPPLTDAEFEATCAAQELFRLERTREGEILMNPPAGGCTSDRHKKQVHIYAPGHKPSITKRKTVEGSGPIAGFVRDLEELWRCYEI